MIAKHYCMNVLDTVEIMFMEKGNIIDTVKIRLQALRDGETTFLSSKGKIYNVTEEDQAKISREEYYYMCRNM